MATKKPVTKTTKKTVTQTKKTATSSKPTGDFILVRPRANVKTRSDYQLFVRASFKEKNYVSLGPYSANDKIEEYCHKDDVEYYTEIRNKELN